MQFVQNACMINLVVSSILTASNTSPYKFTWNSLINYHRLIKHDYNYDDARFLLKLSLMVTSANLANTSLNPPNIFTEHIELIYEECPKTNKVINLKESFTKLKGSAVLGHLLYDKINNTLFIVFSGTSNTCMAGLDLEYTQIELDSLLNYSPGMKAHQGITVAYLSIRKQLINHFLSFIPQNPKIIITGHSLGGALGQLCALDLAFYKPIHYTFASPLILNQLSANVFEKFITNSYRITNQSDLVTMSPLPVMPNGDIFLHVGKLIMFQRNLGEYPANHSIAYLQEFTITED